MDVYLVRYRCKRRKKLVYWKEGLNEECANALAEILAEDGQDSTIVKARVPAKVIASFAVSTRTVPALADSPASRD